MVVKPPFQARRRNCVSLTHIIAIAYDGKDFTACLLIGLSYAKPTVSWSG